MAKEIRNKRETLLSPAGSSTKINKTATGRLRAGQHNIRAAVGVGVAAAVSPLRSA